MKSERIAKDNIKKERFPALYISDDNDIIILATDETDSFLTGLAVWEPYEAYSIGHYSTNWDKDVFSLFEGEIMLKN